MNTKPERGAIYIANFDPVLGSELRGMRPCVVMQNDPGNLTSKTTIVIPFTTRIPDRWYTFAVVLDPSETGLPHTSVAKCDQIRVITIERRLLKRVGQLTPDALHRIERAILFELEIFPENHL